MDKQDGQSQQSSLHQPSNTAYLPEPGLAESSQEKQLTSQQRSAQSQAIPAQPATTSSSHLNGIAGWLAFFMVVVTIGALVSATMFFTSLLDISQPYAIISIIMAPIVVTLAIATAVMVSRRKRLGGRLAIATLVASFLHTILMTVTYTLIDGLETSVVIIYIAIMQAIAAFLCCLYFRISRRVKETLVG